MPVFCILGAAFTLLGLALTVGIATAAFGIIFARIGSLGAAMECALSTSLGLDGLVALW